MDTATTWAPVLARYAERLHARAGSGHHVISPLGAWMVLALCVPAAREERDRDALGRALRADPDASFQMASSLLGDPHPLVSAAAGLWLAAGAETPRFAAWRAMLPEAVECGALPTQAALDAWAAARTHGLIDRFPIEVTPTLVCVLASALATKVSWEVPLEVVDAGELEPSRWSETVRGALRAPQKDPRHRQFLALTERAGTVCVHLARARGGLLVGSVIAAEEDLPPGDVLAAAEEIVTAEAAEHGRIPRLSLFDLPAGDGPVWSIHEGPTEDAVAGGREERVVSVLPAWRATTTLGLTQDEDLGFDEAARAIASVLGLQRFAYEARQACTARYSAVGFEAAAVTALGVRTAALVRRRGVVRTATVRFAHPYAVVAVAFDDDRGPERPTARTPWHGLPVFSAWVTERVEADQDPPHA